MRAGLAAALLAAACSTDAPARTAPGAPLESGLRELRLTLVDDGDTSGVATFQSHVQKVVANGAGIFMTHVRSSNEDYTAQTWRLSRSTDGGASFETLYEETAGTNPPALETDAAGDLYLARGDYGAGPDAWLYVFRAADGYAEHTRHRIPGGSAGKYAMVIDQARGRLHYLSHNSGELCSFDLTGRLVDRFRLVAHTERASLQYPHLALDERGALFAAWTTHDAARDNYRSIHVLRSGAADRRWARLDGERVARPVDADEDGPATAVVPAAELDVSTWLWSMLPRAGKLQLAYLAQTDPPAQRYVRFDLESGAEDLRLGPAWGGARVQLSGLDGFAVADPRDPRRSFWVGHAAGGVGVLCSDDAGASWRDHALSAPLTRPYAIGGYRRVTDDRRIVGALTDVGDPGRVWFFSVDAD